MALKTVVLDDDPTGSQCVRNTPVITRWGPTDVAWGLAQPGGALFVLTNSRSVGGSDAATMTRDAVTQAVRQARADNDTVRFVSRGDSTLRGHFPLEPLTIAAVLDAELGPATDNLRVSPGFPGGRPVDSGQRALGPRRWRAHSGGAHRICRGQDLSLRVVRSARLGS